MPLGEMVADRGDPGVERGGLEILAKRGTAVTERVYWHEIRPSLTQGAEAMDQLSRQDCPANAIGPAAASLLAGSPRHGPVGGGGGSV
jgi:hypothetical protein